jgi:two-component system sporulation sensor kinase A
MNDDEKTREQLLEELLQARSEIDDLHALIARQQKVEDELRESEEKYLIHFSLANDVMFSYDNQFRILTVSPNVERILGYKPEELIGSTFHDLHVLHPDCMELAVTNALKVLSGNTVHSSVYRFIAKDGTSRFGEVSGVPRVENGRVIGSVTVARYITRRMEMQKSLQENEERYRLTLQTIPDAVSIVRLEDSRFLYNNEAFFKITGYTPDESIGKTPVDLDLPASSEMLEHCLELMNADRSVDSIECQCRKKDGTIIDTIVSASAITYGRKKLHGHGHEGYNLLKQVVEEKKTLEIQIQRLSR